MGCDAIGKGRQIGEKGQLALQKALVNKGIGVAVDGQGAPFLPLVAQYEGLPRENELFPPQIGIVPQKLPDGEPVGGGDGGQSVPRPDGVYLGGIADDDGLPCYQLSGVGQLIIRQ